MGKGKVGQVLESFWLSFFLRECVIPTTNLSNSKHTAFFGAHRDEGSQSAASGRKVTSVSFTYSEP